MYLTSTGVLMKGLRNFLVRLPKPYAAKGHKGLYKRAVEKYKGLKKNLHPRPLPGKLSREMTRIVKHADESLVGKLGE